MMDSIPQNKHQWIAFICYVLLHDYLTGKTESGSLVGLAFRLIETIICGVRDKLFKRS
jgi:hypothetical protein